MNNSLKSHLSLNHCYMHLIHMKPRCQPQLMKLDQKGTKQSIACYNDICSPDFLSHFGKGENHRTWKPACSRPMFNFRTGMMMMMMMMMMMNMNDNDDDNALTMFGRSSITLSSQVNNQKKQGVSE